MPGFCSCSGGNYKIIRAFLLSGTISAFPGHAGRQDFQNFSLSFGKVSKIFTCPALLLPVPDRRTVCNFHPCLVLLQLKFFLFFSFFFFGTACKILQTWISRSDLRDFSVIIMTPRGLILLTEPCVLGWCSHLHWHIAWKS